MKHHRDAFFLKIADFAKIGIFGHFWPFFAVFWTLQKSNSNNFPNFLPKCVELCCTQPTTIGLDVKSSARKEFGSKNADFTQKWSKYCISGTKHRVKTASTIFWGSFEPKKRRK